MVSIERMNQHESYFPLKVFVCDDCWLVQVDEMEKASNIFNHEYTYFSSYSSSWLKHVKEYTDFMCDKFNFNSDSLILEIASNDGYLLQYFKEKGFNVLGVEPTQNTAEVAKLKGIESIVDFFSEDLAKSSLQKKADLIIGNNVIAHVPNLNDFIRGVKISLKNDGIATFEFPHLCKLVEFNQFDTIYHEHFSYLSLTCIHSIFKQHGLELFDVQELSTHGGSLRIFLKHPGNKSLPINPNVERMLNYENSIGICNLDYYLRFQEKIEKVKIDLLSYLIKAKKEGKKVAGYGAAAKGNTLLNFCGIKGTDFIKYVVDASPIKQNKFLPGSRIPVVEPSVINIDQPDIIIIFPWNLKDEVLSELAVTRKWGCEIVTFIPEFKVL
jgi:SAM-dependent methyltransferase